MPILDIPHRNIKVTSATLPSFPAIVSIQAVLTPPEVFGEAVLSGRLPVSPHGHKVQVKTDMWHGGITREAGGRFPHLKADGPFFDLTFHVDRNVAHVEGSIATETGFKRCIELVAHDLPAFVSAALDAPVAVSEVFGSIAGHFFEVQVQGQFESVVKVLDAPTAVRDTLTRLAGLPQVGAERVFAALRYMNHARWLAYVATYPAQFVGEQLLNLNKAIEALLPHGTIDDLREQLRKLGLRPEAVELLASLSHVRNQVDVGHAAVELLAAKEHRDLHRFVMYAMEIVAWLINHVIVLSADGKFEPRRPSTGKSSRDTTLARMGDLLDKLNPLQPETLLIPTPGG